MFTLKNVRQAIVFTALAGLFAGAASSAFADTEWEANHPRREQINERLANQNQRIDHLYREGAISAAQAARLHREVRQARAEERAMVWRNGGYLTPYDQHILNQREDTISRQIRG